MDNLAPHKAAAARRALDRAGLAHRYPPPYSPDFDPIALAWSKLKETPRQVGARGLDTLDAAMPAALASITPDDARAWFRHRGYRSGQVRAQGALVVWDGPPRPASPRWRGYGRRNVT
jgi:DDE superfamily endonuclease